MKAKDNPVFQAALQFAKSFPEGAPEAATYGYAKLLSMEESQRKVLLPEGSEEEVELARKYFEKHDLDPELIRSGLLLLVPLLSEADREAAAQGFAKCLDQDKAADSMDILALATSQSKLPLKELFKKGNTIQTVFDFQNSLKSAREEAAKKAEENAKEGGDITKQSGVDTQEMWKAFDEERAREKKKRQQEAEEAARKKSEIHRRDLGDLSKQYRDLNEALLEVVKGQDAAVSKFVRGYNQGELLKQTERGNHPKTYFFFFGPPGVGKTLLAETAAEALGLPHKTFNMSEYAGPQSHEDLIGISQIYKNATEGTLVKFVRENPECLLIFDEVEKAHLNVIRQFLQILGAGRVHNVFRDEETSFQDATIIFTSNVGRELYEDRSVNLTTMPEKVLVDAIQREKDPYGEPALPPEICSRIASGNTVMFNHLSIRHLAEMVRENFDRIILGMKREYGTEITYAKELPLLFLYNRGGEIDARVAVGQSGRFLKDEIYELMRQLESRGSDADEAAAGLQIDIDWKGMDPELKRLFKNEDRAQVLVFSGSGRAFEGLEEAQYEVRRAATLEEAENLMKQDISAVFIDPFYGTRSADESILSISDYNTEGVRLFRRFMETQSGMPVYLLEADREFSEVDRRTFLQEGAAGTVRVTSGQEEAFREQFVRIMEELYMEKESKTFSQRGWVIDFNTRQQMADADGQVRIVFYDLKKRRAVDVESRGSILSDAERPTVRFSDVFGAENAKEELRYFVGYLQNPKQFLTNGGRAPKGVLLYGPPGTGKTMLAKAMAGESDVTFLQTSASEFKNKYVGESEANIRRVFAKARKYAPSIIFIDEIDAIGKKRTGGENASTTESMLNALLTEMDGFSSADISKPVFVLAATNYGVGEEKDGISSLDEALIRRFDNKIYVDLPKESERKAYLLAMLKKKEIDTVSEATASSVAERTTGKSLAILQNVLDLAIRNASKAGRSVEDGDLLTALEEYQFGEKKEHSREYYQEVAIHEVGHAYLSYLSGDKPSYITIESRGDFGGYMQHANQEEVTGYTREEIYAKIRTCLAGRASEKVFFGEEKSLNTGASSDLAQATRWAWQLICSYGMMDGQLVVLNREDILKSSVAAQYIEKVNRILLNQMDATVEILQSAKEKIRRIADVLVQENRLTGEQFEKLMKEA